MAVPEGVLCGACSLIWTLSNLKWLVIWVKCANELNMNKSSWKLFNGTKFLKCPLCSKHFTVNRSWAGVGGVHGGVWAAGVHTAVS